MFLVIWMNNKGFTLVELLATIVILGIVMGIASYGVINAINSSKNKSEEVFVNKLGTFIDSYIVENTSIFNDNIKCGSFIKKIYSGDKTVDISKVGSFSITELVDKEFVDRSKFVNPKNKEDCYNSSVSVNVYRDDDYVYYYSVNFNGVCGLRKYNSLPEGVSSCM